MNRPEPATPLGVQCIHAPVCGPFSQDGSSSRASPSKDREKASRLGGAENSWTSNSTLVVWVSSRAITYAGSSEFSVQPSG